MAKLKNNLENTKTCTIIIYVNVTYTIFNEYCQPLIGAGNID